jgi:hypothetical protein
MSRQTCWVNMVVMRYCDHLRAADRSLVDLNAIAWLEDYLQTWPGTLLVV